MHYKRNTQPLKTNSDSILDVFRRSQRLLILAVVGTFCYAFVTAEQITSHCSIIPFLDLQSNDQRNQEETDEHIMLSYTGVYR